jgi:hypothetical protein
MRVFILSLFFLSNAFAAADYKARQKTLARCRLQLSVELKKQLEEHLIPVMKKLHKAEYESKYFSLTKKVGPASIFFPSLKIFVPLAVVADIIATPAYAAAHIYSSYLNSEEDKIHNAKYKKELSRFKAEWDKVMPNKIKRALFVQKLHLFSLVSVNHQWILDSHGKGEVYVSKDRFDFLFPYFERQIGQIDRPFDGHGPRIKADGEWKSLYRYFHVSDFSHILHAQPKLCSASGANVIDKVAKEFAKRIKDKMKRY